MNLFLFRRPRPAGVRILAIIPTSGISRKMLRKCLRRLRRAARGIELKTMLVLCPHNPDREKEVRTAMGAKDELICLPPPFSFTRSNNAALTILQDEEYVLFLNDDCFFRGRGDLLKLLKTMRKEKLACVGPWLDHWQCRDELPPENRTDSATHTPRPLIGACILWDAAWLKKTGFFDESFSGYGMEEADLSLRTLLQGGCWARDDRIVVDHIHHATVGKSVKSEAPHLHNLRRWQEKYPGIHSWGEGEPWQMNMQKLQETMTVGR